MGTKTPRYSEEFKNPEKPCKSRLFGTFLIDCSYSHSMTATCADPDAAGAALEALSSSNHSTVLPAYFEIALKTKYSRDPDAARMYDLIRSKMELDFTCIYNNAIGNPEGVFITAVASENSLTSTIASRRSVMQFRTRLARSTMNLRSRASSTYISALRSARRTSISRVTRDGNASRRPTARIRI